MIDPYIRRARINLWLFVIGVVTFVVGLFIPPLLVVAAIVLVAAIIGYSLTIRSYTRWVAAGGKAAHHEATQRMMIARQKRIRMRRHRRLATQMNRGRPAPRAAEPAPVHPPENSQRAAPAAPHHHTASVSHPSTHEGISPTVINVAKFLATVAIIDRVLDGPKEETHHDEDDG